MMKKYIFTIMLAIMPLWMMGQASGGQVTRPAKTTTAPKKTTSTPKKTSSSSRTSSHSSSHSTSAEAAGYDVTFSSNVSAATLYIDGNINGTASGSRFLKTGTHTVKLVATGYQTLERTITVNSRSKSFTLNMSPNQTTTSYTSSSSSGYSGTMNLRDMTAKALGRLDCMHQTASASTLKSVLERNYTLDYDTDDTNYIFYVWSSSNSALKSMTYRGMTLDYYHVRVKKTSKTGYWSRWIKYSFELDKSYSLQNVLNQIVQDYHNMGINISYQMTSDGAAGKLTVNNIEYEIEVKGGGSSHWTVSLEQWIYPGATATTPSSSSSSYSSSSSNFAGSMNLHDMILKPLGNIDANPWSDSFSTVKSKVRTRYVVDDRTDADDQKLYVWSSDDPTIRTMTYRGMKVDYYYFAINTDKNSSIDRRVKYQFKLDISQDPYPYLDQLVQDFREMGVNISYERKNETYTKATGAYRDGKVKYDMELTRYSTEWNISMNIWRFY